MSGTNNALESLEPSFQQDLNGDGQTGPPPTVSEFPLPTSNGGPFSITAGPDGNVWFTEVNGNKIGQITPAGVISEFSVSGSPGGITAGPGPDGGLWFTEIGGNKIAHITTTADHTITEFTIPTANAVVHRITIGPDGNLWFAEAGTDKIGQITTDGHVTEFSLPAGPPGRAPFDIVAGPDGNVWFTEIHGDKIGRITTTPDHTITEFTVHQHPSMIAAGPDGALWFSESDVEKSDNVNMIGRITTDGLSFTEFSPPTAGSKPQGITVGPDGALWFTENGSSKIGQITTAGNFSEVVAPANSGPFGIVTGADGHLWFTEFSANKIGQLDHAPIVTANDVNAAPGDVLSAASLFTAADADHDALTFYTFQQMTTDPNSGHFEVNGVAQVPNTLINLSSTQLAQTTFVSGSIAADIVVNAFDGMVWGTPAEFHIV
jgi:virginiamycin B lyase